MKKSNGFELAFSHASQERVTCGSEGSDVKLEINRVICILQPGDSHGWQTVIIAASDEAVACQQRCSDERLFGERLSRELRARRVTSAISGQK